MGRQEKKKPMVFFLRAVGLKPAAFFVVNRHSVCRHFRYNNFVKVKCETTTFTRLRGNTIQHIDVSLSTFY